MRKTVFNVATFASLATFVLLGAVWAWSFFRTEAVEYHWVEKGHGLYAMGLSITPGRINAYRWCYYRSINDWPYRLGWNRRSSYTAAFYDSGSFRWYHTLGFGLRRLDDKTVG